ncbi:MAG: ferric reductase-like transmembrane domain-containing protein [Candidatus ainarchaeum sp.]|nr:ferric reductase-like transmembrane domain-containing protein [Candidatus ainarchaeum sp.]
MERGSFLNLAILCGFAALAAYNSLFQLPAYVVFIRTVGLAGFMLLCVSLMLGPLALIAPRDYGILLAHRRALGIASFALVLAHTIFSFWLQSGLNLALLADANGLIAVAAFLIMLVLTLTSSDWAVKNLPDWKGIQRLAYVAFALSFVHFIIKANGLFAPAGGGVFVNLGEIAMIVLGIATVVLQAYGFYIVRGRKAAAQAAKQNPEQKIEN